MQSIQYRSWFQIEEDQCKNESDFDEGVIVMEDMSILIVEDDAGMRETLGDILRDEGYKVETAGRGKEALALAKEKKFSICLVDLRLPDMSGIEVLKGLKGFNPNVSVIIITAFASKETAISALKDGAHYYIEKPLNIKEVLNAIERASDTFRLLADKKRAEEELRKNEEKYRSLVESTEDSVYLVDRNCRYLFMNEKHQSRLCLSKDQYQGRPYSVFHSTDNAKRFAEKVTHVFETGTSIQSEYKNNEKRCFLKTLSPVKDPETGRATAVTVVSKDITELKRAEKELLETRDYLNNIINSSVDTITVVNMEGIVRDWNKGAEGIMGYRADEVIGTSNRKFFVDPEDADRIMEHVQREGAIENYRTIVVRKDGKPIHISMSAALLRNEKGVPIGTVRVSRDITREVELEKRVKEERDNLNLIFETMVDGVYMVSKDYEVEFMNKVLRDEFGDHPGDICYEVFHGRKEPCPLCKLEVIEGGTVRWEWYSRRINKIYDLIETPLRNIDGTISKLTIFRDISERKKAEEEIQKLNRKLELRVVDLEEVTRMKTEFLSITSHELRTPLTPMKAQLQMLQDGYMGRINKEQKESIEITLRNLTRLENLIKDILDVSIIEMGVIKMSFESMNLNYVVGEAMKMMESITIEKDIKIIAKLAELPVIMGDSERLRQVISNLLNNAIKFSEKSADVVIETMRVGENVQFCVTDYGIGISKENKKKLFKLFSQIDTTMGRKQGGTGLGLAIAKGIVQAHNGKIWVESGPGKGSTFCFSIPINSNHIKIEP